MIDCGNPPVVVGKQKINPVEFMYYLYMPISMMGSTEIKIPKRLKFTTPIVIRFIQDCEWISRYVYITVKSMFVDSACPGSRPGWHIDGFQSQGDLNYIWYDANPTEFAVQEFLDIPNDDQASMVEITRQIKSDLVVCYAKETILRLDETVVHRASPDAKSCFRTFIKITISDHRFTNKGNSKNYLLDYDWPTTQRKTNMRNLDHGQ